MTTNNLLLSKENWNSNFAIVPDSSCIALVDNTYDYLEKYLDNAGFTVLLCKFADVLHMRGNSAMTQVSFVALSAVVCVMNNKERVNNNKLVYIRILLVNKKICVDKVVYLLTKVNKVNKKI